MCAQRMNTFQQGTCACRPMLKSQSALLHGLLYVSPCAKPKQNRRGDSLATIVWPAALRVTGDQSPYISQ